MTDDNGQITQAEVLRVAGELEALAQGDSRTVSPDDLLTAAAVMRVAVDDFQINNLACCEALMRAVDAAEGLERDLWIRRDVTARRWRVVLGSSPTKRAGSIVVEHSGLLPALTRFAAAITAKHSVWHIFEHAGGRGWAEPAELPRFARCPPHRALDICHGLGEGWAQRRMFPDEVGTIDQGRVIE